MDTVESKKFTDPKDVAFLEALISFHPVKHTLCRSQIELTVDMVDGQPGLLANGEAVSIRKCLLGLQQAYLEAVKTKTLDYFEASQLKQACHLLVKVVGKYPFAAKKVNELMAEHFPHQNSELESLLLY